MLGQTIEDGLNPGTGEFEWNNPGRGGLSLFPQATRDYRAFEISYRQGVGGRLMLMASYVLSRSYGNYPGLYDFISRNSLPNAGSDYDLLAMTVNAEGLLPNDRPHMLKLAGSCRIGKRLTAGAAALCASGTPLSEMGAVPGGSIAGGFLRPRGSAGRTPSIWDLNLRLTYAPNVMGNTTFVPSLTLDVLHIASQRRPVDYDQVHYFGIDEAGNQVDPNPTWRNPVRYQPPMALRLGFQIGF